MDIDLIALQKQLSNIAYHLGKVHIAGYDNVVEMSCAMQKLENTRDEVVSLIREAHKRMLEAQSDCNAETQEVEK